MDAERFDTLTMALVAAASRRRVLGGLVGALSAGVPFVLAGAVAAKKKRKRKQNPTTQPPDDCPAGLVACDGRCRAPEGAACSSRFPAGCCSNFCHFGQCFPTCAGKVCTSDADCCRGMACLSSRDDRTCGGCAGPGNGCQTDQDCCAARCNNGLCLSFLGEPCATGFDCLSCFASHFDPAVCARVCVAGMCDCPFECCADSDCSPAERCQGGTCVPIIGGG
jgi:hypothetical protein